MNDNFFIKYEASRMLVELAHRRLCDYIWALDKTPLDDPDTICGIAKIKPQDYARVRGGLERKGWKSVTGVLHHGGVVETLQKCHAFKVGRTA